MQQKENLSTLNQLMAQIQELQDKVKSLNEAKEFCDPENCEQLLDCPTFPVSPAVFRVKEERSAAILACSLIPGIQWIPQDTFLKVYLLEMPSTLVENSQTLASSFLRIEANWYRQNRGTKRRSERRAAASTIQLTPRFARTLRLGTPQTVLEELVLKVV